MANPVSPERQSSSILTRLRQATQAEHESIERRLDVFSEVRDSVSYRWLLQRFHGFFQPMEQALCGVPGMESAVPDLRKRMRTRLLEDDLVMLGFTPGDVKRLPRCTELPITNTVAEGLGCLYVMEGSTLGGQIIVRRLVEKGVDVSSVCGFFLSHGLEVGAMWNRFREAAERYAEANPDHGEAMCAAARQTFGRMEAWMTDIRRTRAESAHA